MTSLSKIDRVEFFTLFTGELDEELVSTSETMNNRIAELAAEGYVTLDIRKLSGAIHMLLLQKVETWTQPGF